MSRLWCLLFVLPLFSLVRRSATFHAVIRHGNHSEVFYFLSNVSEFPTLNPTILGVGRWERLDASRFYVEYAERLSQVPSVTNYARALYEIRHNVDGSHDLASRHLTCFFTDFSCLATESVVRVSKLSSLDVGYREEVSYSCPWVLTTFCFNEVAIQRRLITSKLKEIFSKNSSKFISSKYQLKNY